jgi:transposase-like protein
MDAFLERMRQSGNVYLSCKAAGVPRTTAYRWRDKWSTFAAEWDEAKEDAVDKLDAEAWRRATEEASDRLLMFLLKAHKPSVYNPVQRLQHTGAGEKGEIVIDDARAEYHSRALASLADALGGILARRGDGGDDAMDAAE